MKKKIVLIVINLILGCVFLVKTSNSAVIYKGQTKAFAVAPAGYLSVYYYPSGNSASVLDARTTLWAYWDSGNNPDVKVDIYCGDKDKWCKLYQINVKPWRCSSPTLWLSKGTYRFDISTSSQCVIELRLR